jgi:hypothetical protein
MPRDIHGKAHRSEGNKAAEPVKAGASKDPVSNPKMAKSASDPDDAAMLRDHHDRLTKIEEHLGMAKSRDGFSAEDQGGSHKAGKDKPTVKGHEPGKPRRAYS